jgi:hypothetical protein
LLQLCDEPALSKEETQTLIDYARRKFAEERWPMSEGLKLVREALAKLDPKPKQAPLLSASPMYLSLAAQRRKKRR